MSLAGAAAIGIAFVAALAAVAVLFRLAGRLPQATPNERSLHVRAVPRVGGYAIWAGFLPAALWAPPSFPGGGAWGWLFPWLALTAVSARDDVRDVAPAVRLAVHCAAGLACAWWLWTGGAAVAGAPSAWSAAAIASIAALALALAWSANLYNFMDGNDGLAAAMTIVGFCAYGAAALHAGAPAAAFFALAAATLPFFVVNRPRATMFLGDVGAVPLGFLAAAFGAAGVIAGHWPAWFPVLVFLPFVADASVTLCRRALAGERVWEAHHDHHYQRLHRLGAGHAGTLAAYAAAMAVTAGTALGCLVLAPRAGGIALAVESVVCFILFGALAHRWRKRLPASR